METIVSIALGVALSAACGFRVFVPFLVLSMATYSGHVTLTESFSWIGSWPAVVTFSVATALEIGAYYIPWVDNALDTVATPVAVVAGIIITASVVADMSPYLRWTLAIIAGGGVAAMVQTGSVGARSTSAVTTAGMANPVVATLELGGALLTSVAAVLWPFLALMIAALLLVFCIRRLVARRRIVLANLVG